MKKLILILLIFFSYINITNAIPISALAIWYEFILLAIPSLLAFFSIIFFYFRKYLFYINIYLLVFSIFLYFIHFYITKEFFFYNFEYLFFIISIIFFILSYFHKNVWYIVLFFLLSLNIFLFKVDYNLYKFKNIFNCIEKNMYLNIEIIKILYKDNFFVVYWYHNETKTLTYTIIGIWDWTKKCKKIWDYNNCNWWDRLLWKGFSDLANYCIKQ